MEDPFADTPDAVADGTGIRSRAWKRPEAACDLVGNPKRKKADLNPLQRRWFEAHGWTFARVEHSNAWGGMTVDLWGVGDYLACHPEHGLLLVQTCRYSDSSTRLRKARRCSELQAWLAAGGRFEVHGWDQPGGPGSRWEVRRRRLDGEEVAL